MLRSVFLVRHSLSRSNRFLVACRPSVPFAVRTLTTTKNTDTSNRVPSRLNVDRPNNNNKRRKHANEQNFDRKVLQPAARGELVGKHDSGIPRLASRKRHVNLAPPGGSRKQEGGVATGQPRSFFLQEGGDELEVDPDDLMGSGGEPGRKSLLAALSQGRMADEEEGEGNNMDFSASDEDLTADDDYYVPDLIDDHRYFWSEEEYDALATGLDDEDLLDEGEEFFEIPFGKEDVEGGSSFFTSEEEDDGMDFAVDDEERLAGVRREAWQRRDPEEDFFYNQFDLFTIAAKGENEMKDFTLPKEVLPLRDHGPELDDFLETIIEHPSMYARIDHENPHPHSQREPKPDFPPNRRSPPLEFVEAHARFLYVAGLPPLEINGQVGDIDNPVHRSFLQQQVARIVGVDSSRVFPSNTTSAFVGFSSPRELADALARGPSELYISSVPDLTLPKGPAADTEFVKKCAPHTVVHLSNMPPGHTPNSLARDLFPQNTEVGTVYGKNLVPDDFFFLSPTEILLRFSSKEQAESALESQLLQHRLEEIGQYPVQYFRARRELVHAGFGGPTRSKEVRRHGPRLIVDGDMPTKKFFLSHARVIHVRNIDPTLTKKEISDVFQPFCAQRRDVEGSIEFVTCHAGRRTGRVYIGFDIPGEAESVMENTNKSGRMVLGDRSAILRLVKDRRIPRRPHILPEKRPERTEQELLNDLNNWEQYVDPADIVVLEKAGISKVVLDEALRVTRFKNQSFGALDSSLRSEALRPEMGRGGLYKEFVQTYVQTLKECIATPDNVGPLYKGLHFPGEPVDLGIFDREKERQKMLMAKRVKP